MITVDIDVTELEDSPLCLLQLSYVLLNARAARCWRTRHGYHVAFAGADVDRTGPLRTRFLLCDDVYRLNYDVSRPGYLADVLFDVKDGFVNEAIDCRALARELASMVRLTYP